MHLADALLSTPVALTGTAVAVALIATAGIKLKDNKHDNIIPLMGVMGAFIFAAQMINFTIPGTGSSGHIVGGILLAALLGPWAGFLTLVSVIIIQCLIFADGGLMALGCNIINMAAMSTLVAYPLIFRPIAGNLKSASRLIVASVASSIIGLELGAFLVTCETELSGITALQTDTFLFLMSGIHLAIGLGEGLSTSVILLYVKKSRPSLLESWNQKSNRKVSLKPVLISFATGALVLGGVISLYASENPDGLEWSIQKIIGSTEIESNPGSLGAYTESLQKKTSLLPDYENRLSGIFGAVLVVILIWAFSSLLIKTNKKKEIGQK